MELSDFLMKINLNDAGRVALIFIAALLVFGGPTYFVYILQTALPYSISVFAGLITFVVGLILLVRLLGKDLKLEASE